jgi:TRAP-type C4-dicarboxylate transport system permease large subunit
VDTLKATSMILWITLGAKAYVAIFTGLGGADTLLAFIKGLEVNRWLILAAMMLLLIFLGTVLDELGIILLTVPVFLPIVRLLGFRRTLVWRALRHHDPDGLHQPALWLHAVLHQGHAAAAHRYGRGVPRHPALLVLQFVGLLICAAFPDLVTFLPKLMASR